MLIICFLLCLFSFSLQAQDLFPGNEKFTEADTLRGSLNKDRTCFDVYYYHLDIKVEPDSQFISGSNTIGFKAVHSFKRMQLDLFQNMDLKLVMHGKDTLKFVRHHNAFYVYFDQNPRKDSLYEIKVYYEGKPTVAKHAPWDGGFVWEKDSSGKHWVGVACEGFGASSWWPNKDHLSDEPDSMLISVTVPIGLMNVSNGQFVGTEAPAKGWKQYNWKVSYPINNYNVTVNIADYYHFSDTFQNESGTHPIDYYVLPANKEKAKKQFEQVKPMLQCYEEYLGEYPFWRDGYKLVETPYLGMEHQSAIAYGNKYKTGYAGTDYSRIGLDFDYIIIHETGHEWWGNLVSAADIADLWIHEGFCTYSEAIYVECMYDYQTALDYINAKKPGVKNKRPILGVYGVNNEGSGDMYSKGMLILNTLRSLVEDDDLWWNTIRGLINEFGYKTTSTEEVVDFLSEKLNKDLHDFFEQYLAYSNIPVLEYKLDRSRKSAELSYRWKADVATFDMPVIVRFGTEEKWIFPKTTEWKKIEIPLKKKEKFSVANELFYIGVKELKD
jgi:aminopeptidase N